MRLVGVRLALAGVLALAACGSDPKSEPSGGDEGEGEGAAEGEGEGAAEGEGEGAAEGEGEGEGEGAAEGEGEGEGEGAAEGEGEGAAEGEGEGEDVCGPIADGQCPGGMVCDIRSCGDGALGECAVRPQGCDANYDPVCGCDGKTYSNDCQRLAVGAQLDQAGECQEPANECGPWLGGDCPAQETCDVHGCGMGAGGQCVARPDACAQNLDPVCGCDGETYGNDCARIMAGAPLDHAGECDIVAPS